MKNAVYFVNILIIAIMIYKECLKMEFENEISQSLNNYLLADYYLDNYKSADEEQTADEENEAEVETIDYSSILQEMNQRLENIEAKTIDYSEPMNGLLANIYFLDFVAFTVFVFVLVCLVIKFFKIFF